MNNKYFLRKIIISNKFLNVLLFNYWRFVNYRTRSEIISRKNNSIEEIEILAKPLKRCPHDNILDNSFYGISSSLKSYSKYSKKLNCFVEHGVYFGSLIHQFERDHYISNIIAPSLIRKKHLGCKTNKNVVVIGPYIHYASDYLDNKSFKKIKEHYGKILLVFPDHSMTKVNSIFDASILISNIERLKKDYDTVMVCLYWKDILLGRQKEYLIKGYKVVTAGHVFDENFLSRLKLIIKLSDYSISNSVGTHLGYSIYLNKPHTVFKQDIIYDSDDKNYLKYDRSIYNDESWNSREQELLEVENAFSIYSNTITKKQIQIVDKYWGLSEIKEPIELFNIFKSFDRH